MSALASIIIRNIDDALKDCLRRAAAQHGRSMEEEARDILRAQLSREVSPPDNLAAAIRARVSRFGGVDLPEVVRDPMREPPSFEA